MMTINFFLGLSYQGCGHDDMIMQKQPKKRHHVIITNGYDDMTKIQGFPRVRVYVKTLFPP